MQRRLSSKLVGRQLVVTSLACIVVTVFPVIVAAALTPDYSHVSQFISELGATGAPYEWWVRLAGFLPAGLLMLAFSCIAYIALPRSRQVTLSLAGLALYAMGYLVASVFPCDLGCRPLEPSTSQLIHNTFGMAGYLVAPAFLFTLARKARGWPGAGRLVVAGYIASAVALAGVLTLSPSSDVVGLSQRALEAAVLLWVAMLGVYVARRGTIAG
ncbi:MAG: DUF998 domain-containing protein [Woeseiaceae bacterium]|nr:DUF998 domain-containing protein [Woeseiaceae bacterium]